MSASSRREQLGPAEGRGSISSESCDGERADRRKHLENPTRQGWGQPGVLTGSGEQVALPHGSSSAEGLPELLAGSLPSVVRAD